ncbi:RDD family protein [Microbacterium lushaniae]|nr:RDD family protein [Microbacterium lushaniae]KAA9152691.1 RDD family protein [Microbacterium lushaniae]
MAQGPSPDLVRVAQDETLTGEAVALDVQSAGFFLRALGALLDFLAGVAVLLLMAAVVTWLVNAGALSEAMIPPVAITVLVLVTVVVPTTVETLTRGRSLGKLAVGARIVRADGGAIGFRHAFLRALVGVLEVWFTLGSLAALVAIFTPRAQRLGDLLAGTYSERTRTRPLPDPAPGVPPVLAGWATVADVARLPDRLAARIAQFVRAAPELDPAARLRLAETLAVQARPFVAPLPPVDADVFLHGVAAVRRDRELRALRLQDERVAALVPPGS